MKNWKMPKKMCQRCERKRMVKSPRLGDSPSHMNWICTACGNTESIYQSGWDTISYEYEDGRVYITDSYRCLPYTKQQICQIIESVESNRSTYESYEAYQDNLRKFENALIYFP